MKKIYLIRLSLTREGHTVWTGFLPEEPGSRSTEPDVPAEFQSVEEAKQALEMLNIDWVFRRFFPTSGLCVDRPAIVACTEVLPG